MAARKTEQTQATSELAKARIARGVPRHELARRAGISYESLKRLEYEQVLNAPFWWYRNLSMALRVPLDEILDDRELGWRKRNMAPQPPPPGWLDEYEPLRPA